ncbi:hypothetical protein D9980_16810 [Serratia sp. 3ACOL1]|jgi:hypothetical protein|nr:hypothetical protein D9980_16810 [Serratia sp. 3ACOL1]
MWFLVNAFIIFAFFGVFAFNKNIAKSKKVYLAIATGVLSYTVYYYSAAKSVFFVICLFVFFGLVIQCLNNTNRLSLKSFVDLYMTYLMLPFLFVMRIILSWAGVI